MKLIDENGKLFGKINIVDLIVIISVLVLVGGAGFRMMKGSSITETTFTDTQNVQFIVKVERVRDYGMLREGDILYDKDSGKSLGTIINVEKEQAQDRIALDDGSIVLGDTQDRYNFYLTIESEGEINERGTFANPTFQLLRGSKKAMHTKYSEFTGTIFEIL